MHVDWYQLQTHAVRHGPGSARCMLYLHIPCLPVQCCCNKCDTIPHQQLRIVDTKRAPAPSAAARSRSAAGALPLLLVLRLLWCVAAAGLLLFVFVGGWRLRLCGCCCHHRPPAVLSAKGQHRPLTECTADWGAVCCRATIRATAGHCKRHECLSCIAFT
jgi:hypothetical protein